MAQGGFINVALPAVQEGASKVLDKVVYSQDWSKGTPVGRDIKNNQITDDEVLNLARENALARVKRGDALDTSADTTNNVVRINSADGTEKLAHELTHLSLARQAEPFYQQIANLAKTDPEAAEKAFIGLRAHMESAARESENRVGASQTGEQFVKAVDDPHAIGETVAGNAKTYNQNWQAEWQQFSKDTAYRPEIEYAGAVPNIVDWTAKYEKWMSDHIKIVPEDLAQKHIDMAKDPFLFLRATYYRWAKMFPELLPELQDAPVVRSVGDLHIGNFGTWLNRMGRLIWGVNDFDEAHPLPYTNDLVRLLTSANFLRKAGDLNISLDDASDAILDGYKQSLKDGGKAFTLDKGNSRLDKIARSQMPKKGTFWPKLKGQLTSVDEASVPEAAAGAIDSRMPSRHGDVDYGQRQAGEGSLGRQRFVGLTQARGKNVAIEAKEFLPSASYFANDEDGGKSYFESTIKRAVRSRDPYLGVEDGWVVRKLSPNNTKIDLAELARIRDERSALYAMGYETANIHLGTKGAAKAVLADLKQRDDNWLVKATKKMTDSTLDDHEDWKEHMEQEKK